MILPASTDHIASKQSIPGVDASCGELGEDPFGVFHRPARGVHLNEFSAEEFVLFEPVYAHMDMNLLAFGQRFRSGAGGEEGGEGCGVNWDALLVHVV